jgi:protein SCO1/2
MKKSTAVSLVALLLIASIAASALVWAAMSMQGSMRNGARGNGPAAVDAAPVRQVPAFTLTDQRGEAFASGQLDGKVWVANFIFTRCRGVCPILSHNMAQVQEAMRPQPYWPEVRLVSISVDEAHDTPEVLRDYAARHGADPEQWVFLTGPRAEVWPLIEKGFALPVGENPADAAMPFMHSSKLVLVDRQGWVRGYFDGMSDQGRQELLAQLPAVLGEK